MGAEEAALLLLHAGADPSIQDDEERTAGQVARRWGHSKVADIIER